MTYCIGVLLEEGLVLASDTRTNAGVDQVAISPKMHKFEVRKKRVIVLLTSGNLANTQAVVNRLKSSLEKNKQDSKHLHNVDSLFDAAGNLLKLVQRHLIFRLVKPIMASRLLNAW